MITTRLMATAATLSLTAGMTLADGHAPEIDLTGLELVSELRIPSDRMYDDIPFGGISGLDAVGGDGNYVALSDDRSEEGPARFYNLSVAVDDAGQIAVEVDGATTIQTPDDGAYAEKTVDPEAIRYAARSDSYYWVSEIDADGQAMLRQMAVDGADLGALALPDRLRNSADGVGHVKSASLEALALTADGTTLYTMTENALQQDGPRSSAVAASPTRLLQIDIASGQTTAEYLYVVDPIGHVSQDADRPWSDNGVNELLSIGEGRFVAVERNGWHVGNFEFHFSIKAYLVEIGEATDISDIDALATADVASIQPVTKTLLVDFNRLGLDTVDNIEAVALGPVIDGAQSLIFASDNNFDGRQVTQFLLMK